ncbi:hypothetical protein [Dyadobacter sp. 32]|uniref:hypothetical protein n=1 Tax=Dyadobacter sp. 32 TaxID=538966 RepID=UPI0011EC923C
MKMKFTLASLILFSLMQVGCKGVKNVSGTLSKSDSGKQHPDYNRDGHVDYTKVGSSTAPVRTDTAFATGRREDQQRAVDSGARQKERDADRNTGNGSYKKDYGRMATGGAEVLPNSTGVVSFSNAEVNEKLIRQYAEMDRLADLVVYELGILDKRWDILLSKYKTASSTEREKLSADLDQLNADQIQLYKAHVRIYKDGKTDWATTKRDVEATLLNVRGLGNK